MSSTNSVSTVSVGLLRILRGYAESVGVGFPEVLAEENLDSTLLDDVEMRISAKRFQSLWNRIVSLSGDAHPGLHFGQEMASSYPAGSVLFMMMVNCSTLQAALNTFVRYHRVMADFIEPEITTEKDSIHFSWRIQGSQLHSTPHLSEALLCTYYLMVKHLTGNIANPMEVCFARNSPEDPQEYLKVFQCPLRFSAEKDEIILSPKALNIPLRLADSGLLKVLEEYADRIAVKIGRQKIWSGQVLNQINAIIHKGQKPDIDTISKKLGLGRRTLQKMLKDEQTSFRHCLDMVREEIARDYLRKPGVSICDVAFLLGYSEQSAFNHAFKRWTGKTPREFQEHVGV